MKPLEVWPVRHIRSKWIERAKIFMIQNPIVLTSMVGNTSQLESLDRRQIPECLFVGATNAGKSSLLNVLVNPPGAPPATKSRPRDCARISKRQGFTRTLSAYTIGSSFRIIDSPGYGFRSHEAQGSFMLEYLKLHSNTLFRAYIATSMRRGIAEQDAQLCTILHREGIPFNVVLSKCDKFKTTAAIQERAEEIAADLNDLCLSIGAVCDDIYITSSKSRHGIDLLRAAIYLSSGLVEANEALKTV